MIKLYWRPQKVSRLALVGIAILSLAGLAAVERFKAPTRGRHYEQKLAAARLAERAFAAVAAERARLGLAIDPGADPTRSGLIGELMTPVTSNSGSLRAKQTSVNPNFAAVMVELFGRAGLEAGDTVAIGVSGSFPALNVCVLAAAETLGLRPIVISSNAASQWGANVPELLWIDWERVLYEHEILSTRSVAASLGGIEDRGVGMRAEGRRIIAQAIERSGVPALEVRDYAESVELRYAKYREEAKGAPIKAYVNVGGGTTSVGTKVGKHVFKEGLNVRPPRGGPAIDSIMSRFADEGVPVIHLVNVQTLARRYGLPVAPLDPPVVGDGAVFSRLEYDPRLAGAFLALIVGALYILVRTDLGTRLLTRAGASKGRPEPMV